MRKLIGFFMLVILVGSLLGWYFTRDTLPAQIRIATAARGGLYYQVGRQLGSRLEQLTGSQVAILVTRGSVENRQLLLGGNAHLAILQDGAVEHDRVVALAPLYRDLVHVIARRGRGIEALADLEGKNVLIGPEGSGMRESADALLRHFRIGLAPLEQNDRYFMELMSDPSLDGAIVTTGLLNPDLGTLLASREFTILPILGTEALAIRFPYFSPQRIPRGFFHEGPPLPAGDVVTVATTSFLAARDDTSSRLVRSALEALYEHNLRAEIPTAIRRREAALWDDLPLHAAARSYFQPYSGLGILANLMESLAALKELLFACGAAFYLIWSHWQRVKQRNLETVLQIDKDRLDTFLHETMALEREQMQTEDSVQLRAYIDQVTEIKLRALEELTNEDLRGDVVFAIFLQQCADLVGKIQAKLDVSG